MRTNLAFGALGAFGSLLRCCCFVVYAGNVNVPDFMPIEAGAIQTIKPVVAATTTISVPEALT